VCVCSQCSSSSSSSNASVRLAASNLAFVIVWIAHSVDRLNRATPALATGYDSAGIATVDADNNIVVSKFASRGSTCDSIDLLRNNSEAHSGHVVGIAHTR
jgi:hypothetical protein